MNNNTRGWKRNKQANKQTDKEANLRISSATLSSLSFVLLTKTIFRPSLASYKNHLK